MDLETRNRKQWHGFHHRQCNNDGFGHCKKDFVFLKVQSIYNTYMSGYDWLFLYYTEFCKNTDRKYGK